MITLWRISNHIDLAGLGGTKFSSRWSSRGNRIVFLAESPAGAILEVLVHLKDRSYPLPSTYSLLEIEAPETHSVKELMPRADAKWRSSPKLTQRIGDQWLSSMETPLGRVPSAIMPRTWNVLLNPRHRDALEVRIISVIREQFDNRLFRFGTR
ncbi:MAG: RES family NAD+ phosphorylase [Terracidiphilus sp.]